MYDLPMMQKIQLCDHLWNLSAPCIHQLMDFAQLLWKLNC